MTWQLDPTHTRIEFSVRHMAITTVKGQFKEYSVDLNLDPDNLANSSAKVVIKAESIDTNEAERRDPHLRSADFFDVANFPEIIYQSHKIESQGGNRYLVQGDLTIKEVTRPVELEVELLGIGQSPFGFRVAGFEASGKISRKEFGLTWNVALEAGGMLVGDEIKIRIDAEATEQAAAPAEASATAG